MSEAITEAIVDAVKAKKGIDRIDTNAVRKYIKEMGAYDENIRLMRESKRDTRKNFKSEGVPVGDVDKAIRAITTLHALTTAEEEVPVLMDTVTDQLGFARATVTEPEPDSGYPEPEE